MFEILLAALLVLVAIMCKRISAFLWVWLLLFGAFGKLETWLVFRGNFLMTGILLFSKFATILYGGAIHY
jgi:hypothetical protein